jgi:hypothetical protein
MKKYSEYDEYSGEIRRPPSRSNGILSDISYFFLNKPEIQTLVKFESESERLSYSQRIMQRIGININRYTILNMHKIGIEAPVSYVFEELLKWNGDSTCWPNHIANVNLKEGRLEDIQINMFGFTKYPFGLKKGIFGMNFVPLFNLNAIKFQKTPDPVNFDNARYLLYESSGGYPIGIFSPYIRSSIAARKEEEQTQLFLLVGFNFYGKEEWSKKKIINKLWESIHDRVTSNVLNRFKQLCEWRFEKIQEG